MKASERVRAIADKILDEAEEQTLKSGQQHDNDVQRITHLASSKALLAMVRVLRGAEAELKAEELKEAAAKQEGTQHE